MHAIYQTVDNGARAEVYERDVVHNAPYTVRELRFAYECMRDPAGLKLPFITTVAPDMVAVSGRAVRYFTNRDMVILGTDHATGRVIVQSPGQV